MDLFLELLFGNVGMEFRTFHDLIRSHSWQKARENDWLSKTLRAFATRAIASFDLSPTDTGDVAHEAWLWFDKNGLRLSIEYRPELGIPACRRWWMLKIRYKCLEVAEKLSDQRGAEIADCNQLLGSESGDAHLELLDTCAQYGELYERVARLRLIGWSMKKIAKELRLPLWKVYRLRDELRAKVFAPAE